MGIKYQSRIREKTSDGVVNSLTYQGTKAQMQEISDIYPMGGYFEEGRVKYNRVQQADGAIWNCELRFESDSIGEYTVAPAEEYGAKSAQLRGSMLSLPLEAHADYRANWNHFLAIAPGATGVPAWWENAKDTIIESAADGEKYAWVKGNSELPTASGGRRWRICKEPLMPGVENYDVATYTVTETARCRSADAAGKMVANTLNKIGAPDNTFGIKGGDWKCDDAGVSWSGKYWLATLTWTKSGDEKGWNKKLYS